MMVQQWSVLPQTPSRGCTFLATLSTKYDGWTMMRVVAKATQYAGPKRDQWPLVRERCCQQRYSTCWVRLVKMASSTANWSVCDSMIEVCETAMPIIVPSSTGQHQEPMMKGNPTSKPVAEYAALWLEDV